MQLACCCLSSPGQGEILDEAMEECDKYVNGCLFDKDDLDGHTYVIDSAIIPANELEIVVRFNAVNECHGEKFQLTFELKSDGPYQPAPLAVKNGRVYAVMKSGMNPRLTDRRTRLIETKKYPILILCGRQARERVCHEEQPISIHNQRDDDGNRRRRASRRG